MWALVKANQVIKIFNGAQAFEHNDIKHPANIFQVGVLKKRQL